jgi:hypothetical protein
LCAAGRRPEVWNQPFWRSSLGLINLRINEVFIRLLADHAFEVAPRELLAIKGFSPIAKRY